MKKFKLIIFNVKTISKIAKSKNKKVFILFLILLANISALLDILIILIFSYFFGAQEINNKFAISFLEMIINFKIIFPIIILLRFSTIFMQSYFSKVLDLIVESDLKNYLMEKSLEKNNFKLSDSLYFINVLSSHISFFYSSFTTFLVNTTQIIMFLIYLLLINFEFIAIFIVGLFLLFPFIKILLSLSRKYMHISYEQSKKFNNQAQNIIENLFLIKLLDKTEVELKKFNKNINKRMTAMSKNHLFGGVNSILAPFITMFTLSLFVFFPNIISKLTLDFIGITLRLFQSLGNATSTFNKMINSYVHIEVLAEIIQSNNLNINNNGYLRIQNNDSKIALEFNSVNFSFFKSDEIIYENLNFKLLKNNHYVIVGPNGSGKSTLLALCAGVLSPTKGAIKNYSNKIGYVGPNPLIIDGTLRENLLYGTNEIKTDDEVINLIKKFQLFQSEKIGEKTLNMNIDNQKLSSGQMQKISFIRALISDIDLLILDESTSNLDKKSKELVLNIIREINNITILNSTHEPIFNEICNSKITIERNDNSRILSIT